MSYNIKNFAGTVTYTVNDSTANTNAVSLTLLGKSLPNYGTYFNQNFVWLMENFSSDSANPPPYPVQGQLWWDSTFKFLNVYDGTKWNTAYGNLATISANGAAIVGNLISTNGFYYPNGAPYAGTYSNSNVASYLPTYTGTFGTLSGLTVGGSINAVNVYATTIGNTASAINGNLVTVSAVYAGTIGNTGATFRGASGTLTGTLNANAITANSMYAGTIGNTGASFIGTTFNGATGTFSGTLNANIMTANAVYAGTIGNTGAVHTGASAAFTGPVQASNFYDSTGSFNVNLGSGGTDGRGVVAGYSNGSYGSIGYNLTHTATTNTYNKPQNDQTTMLRFDSGGMNLYSNSNTTAQSSITLSQILGINNAGVTTHYGAVVPSANNSITLGSASAYWSTVYAVNLVGTSTTAQYADLAEKYILDAEYPLGTVIMIGGDAEATQHDGRSIRAIGAVSTNPAYMMNSGLENGTYIALKGRVPVRVIGPVTKGQSLRGGPSGLAIAESQGTPYTFAIAMETVSDIIETTIEAVIL